MGRGRGGGVSLEENTCYRKGVQKPYIVNRMFTEVHTFAIANL